MLDSPPIPHRCRRGPRCPDRARMDDGTVLGRHINQADGLCPSCTQHLARTLTDLPRDYVELERILGAGSTTGEPVSGTRDLPVPIRLSVEALQAEIVHETVCWAESVAEVMRIDWDTQGAQHSRAAVVLQRAAHLLSGAVSVLLALQDVAHVTWDSGHRNVCERDGITGALTLLHLHHLARAHTGQTRLVHRLPAPCPRCWHNALERENGVDIIHCRACDRPYTLDEYDRLCNALASSREVA